MPHNFYKCPQFLVKHSSKYLNQNKIIELTNDPTAWDQIINKKNILTQTNINAITQEISEVPKNTNHFVYGFATHTEEQINYILFSKILPETKYQLDNLENDIYVLPVEQYLKL